MLFLFLECRLLFRRFREPALVVAVALVVALLVTALVEALVVALVVVALDDIGIPRTSHILLASAILSIEAISVFATSIVLFSFLTICCSK